MGDILAGVSSAASAPMSALYCIPINVQLQDTKVKVWEGGEKCDAASLSKGEGEWIDIVWKTSSLYQGCQERQH